MSARVQRCTGAEVHGFTGAREDSSRRCLERPRHEMCGDSGMAKRFEDLMVWQLADRLRREVHALSARQHVRRDVRFCDQLRDSASGIPRNIAEGFGHYRHAEFARYLFIARGSLMELRDHLRAVFLVGTGPSRT